MTTLRLLEVSVDALKTGPCEAKYMAVPANMSTEPAVHVWMDDGKYAILWSNGNYTISSSSSVGIVQNPMLNGVDRLIWLLIRGITLLNGVLCVSMIKGREKPKVNAKIIFSLKVKSEIHKAVIDTLYTDGRSLVTRLTKVKQTTTSTTLMAITAVRYVHIVTLTKSGVHVIKTNIDISHDDTTAAGTLGNAFVHGTTGLIGYRDTKGAKLARIKFNLN